MKMQLTQVVDKDGLVVFEELSPVEGYVFDRVLDFVKSRQDLSLRPAPDIIHMVIDKMKGDGTSAVAGFIEEYGWSLRQSEIEAPLPEHLYISLTDYRGEDGFSADAYLTEQELLIEMADRLVALGVATPEEVAKLDAPELTDIFKQKVLNRTGGSIYAARLDLVNGAYFKSED